MARCRLDPFWGSDRPSTFVKPTEYDRLLVGLHRGYAVAEGDRNEKPLELEASVVTVPVYVAQDECEHALNVIREIATLLGEP